MKVLPQFFPRYFTEFTSLICLPLICTFTWSMIPQSICLDPMNMLLHCHHLELIYCRYTNSQLHQYFVGDSYLLHLEHCFYNKPHSPWHRLYICMCWLSLFTYNEVNGSPRTDPWGTRWLFVHAQFFHWWTQTASCQIGKMQRKRIHQSEFQKK